MSDYHNNQVKKESINSNITHPVKSSQRISKNPEDNQAFMNFWSSYPVKKKKQQAYRMWVKLNPDEKLIQLLMNDVKERLGNDTDWIEGYIPHPSTYLNPANRRWEDAIVNKGKLKQKAIRQKEIEREAIKRRELEAEKRKREEIGEAKRFAEISNKAREELLGIVGIKTFEHRHSFRQ